MNLNKFVLALLLISANAQAVEPIKVMVIHDNNVPSTIATGVIAQINNMMTNTGLSSYDFVNAHPSNGSYLVTCGTGDHDYFIDCAQSSWYVKQGQINADLAIVMAPSLPAGSCGGINDGVINLDNELLINRLNYENSWATVSYSCFLNSGLYPVSHEVGHLLYIEHEDDDPAYNKPVRHNHAATHNDKGTAVAAVPDCKPQYTGCNTWENKLSAKGSNFAGGGASGDDDRNAKKLVTETSWAAVAAYRPVPSPTMGSCSKIFLGCPPGCGSSPYTLTWSGSDADSYEVQKKVGVFWTGWYYGSNTQSFASTGTVSSVLFRIRALNEAGSSGWCQVLLPVQCSQNDDPF